MVCINSQSESLLQPVEIMAALDSKLNSNMFDLQSFGRLILNVWDQIYMPIPELITERRKVLIGDFFLRLFVWWPMGLLSFFGSRPQLIWLRLFFNMLTKLGGKRIGENEFMKVTEENFDGVPVRVYEPKKRKSNAAIIFIHGGGFTFCSARSYDIVTRYISRRAGLVLVSIDYRLAPEHRYPAGVEDCERAAAYFMKNAQKTYSVDPDKVVIMGDSAGGNLTAVTIHRLRKQKIPQPKLQVLIYPWLQMLDFNLPSYQKMEKYTMTSMLGPKALARFALHYLIGDDIEQYIPDLMANKHTTVELRHSPSFDHVNHDRLPKTFSFVGSGFYDPQKSKPTSANMKLYSLMQPYLLDPNVCPLVNPRLDGTCKTMILTVEVDSLRDDGILYAERLRRSGIEVLHKHYQEGFHGMFGPALKLGRQSIKDIIVFINENL